MSIQPRFYAPGARATGDIISLPDDESRHLIRVLRLSAGAAVRVFDGCGHEFDAVVESIGRKEAAVRVGERRQAAAEPGVALTLAQAVLKGDKMDDVVRDAVMLGVTAIQPIVTVRTEMSLAALERRARQQRWQRIAVSSAKQCGRAVVPQVSAPMAFEALLDRIKKLRVPAHALMCVEPDGRGNDAMALADLDPSAPSDATLIVGPEGGWDPRETEAGAVCRQVTLGSRTIRADAMTVVAIAALFTLWKEL